MRIIKYNRAETSKAEAVTYQNVELAQQVASLSNQLNDWFTMDDNGVLVSNYSLASTNQVSSNYIIEQQADIKIYDSKIEYLEFTGTQYIDTGIIQNSLNYELTIQMQWTGDVLSQQEVFVGYMATQYPRNFVQKYNGNWLAGTNTTSNDFGDGVDSEVHSITLSCTDTTETITLDGNVSKSYTVNANGISNNTLSFYLGCRNRGNGNTDHPAKYRLMGFSYKEFTDSTHSTVNKRCELIPVRVGTTGYMYDKVSNQLLGSTSDFVLGSDIV